MTVDESFVSLVTLTVTLMIHLVVTVWWAASLTKRVDHIERWMDSHAQTAERLVALEQQIDNISNGIARIERHLRPIC